MKTKEEFRTVKAIIEDILSKDDTAKNSDKWLTYRVFETIAKKYNQSVWIPFSLFKVFPAFETVKRIRAIIQNKEHRFMPTDPKVSLRRRQRQKEIKEVVK